jgi:hypothetical protein
MDIDFYMKVYKHHEAHRISTDSRNKFWKEYKDGLDKKQIKRKNELGRDRPPSGRRFRIIDGPFG